MNSRLSAISLVFASLAVAAIPGYASSTKGPTLGTVPPVTNFMLTYNGKLQKPWIPTSKTSAAERTRAAAEASKVKEPTIKKASPTMWTSKYKLYVNCPTAPSDVNFTGPFAIQNAVLHALAYTTIQVCYGTGYTPFVVVNQSYIKIVGQGDHDGDQTLFGLGGPLPTDGSFGVLMLGSYDVVENLTFQNLEFGVLSGVVIQDQFNVVDMNWFNATSIGVGSIGGLDTLVENNSFDINYYPIISVGGASETITGNSITGDAVTITTDGIAVYDSIDSTITNNEVANSLAGLDFQLFNSYAKVEQNHFDGNWYGVYIANFNSGNLFEKNQVNGDFLVGIFSDFTSGLDDLPSNSGVNSFVKNTTLGANFLDILDETGGYIGPAQGNNDETADYYSGNTGDLYSSFPLDIYQQ
jgi:hypothetical protein